MKLTVLGRYGKYPNSNGATCSYLLESRKGTKIILDMGSGSLQNLNKVLPYEQIDGVVISHFHGDHCSDAFVFRNIAIEFIKKGLWKSKLPFFMPYKSQEEFNALKKCQGFDTKIITNGLKASIKDFQLEFFEMKHPLPVFGVRVTDGQKTIAYTADTVMCHNLPLLLQASDLALVDACILSKDHTEKMPHISIKDMAALTKNVPLTVLTHLNEGQEQQTLAEALTQNKNAILAEELSGIEL